MHYSVCIPAVLGGIEIGETLASVSEAGFEHYEFWSWWDLNVDSYAKAQQKEKLTIAAL